MKMKNVIVIPCYNEADRLKFEIFQNFINSHKDYILCFVNDGSKDQTLHQLQKFAAHQNNRVKVYDMPKNGGKSEAVKCGINFMLDNFQIKSIGFLDADLATGFDDYKKLTNHLISKNQKMVFGSRKVESNGQIKRSKFRLFASKMIGMVISLIIGLPVKDSQCGAKVFAPMTAKYVFKRSFLSRWLFDVEMFIRIKNLYQKTTMNFIQEIAVENWEEVEGSHITLSDSLKFPKELLEIAIEYNFKPILGFGFKSQSATVRNIGSKQAA